MSNQVLLKDFVPAALRVFWRIANRWKLNEQQQMLILGIDNWAILQTWRAGDVEYLPNETIIRLSYVFGIFQALNTLLRKPGAADDWLWKSNKAPFLSGQSAMQKMLSGRLSDLDEVRRYLDSELGS